MAASHPADAALACIRDHVPRELMYDQIYYADAPPRLLAALGGGHWVGQNYYHAIEQGLDARSRPARAVSGVRLVPTKKGQMVVDACFCWSSTNGNRTSLPEDA
jgi:hypothetical protein